MYNCVKTMPTFFLKNINIFDTHITVSKPCQIFLKNINILDMGIITVSKLLFFLYKNVDIFVTSSIVSNSRPFFYTDMISKDGGNFFKKKIEIYFCI